MDARDQQGRMAPRRKGARMRWAHGREDGQIEKLLVVAIRSRPKRPESPRPRDRISNRILNLLLPSKNQLNLFLHWRASSVFFIGFVVLLC